jgi:hypothetical protein
VNLRRPVTVVTALAASAVALAVPAATSPSVAAEPDRAFTRTATYPVYKNLPADLPSSSETVAEISDVSDDGDTLVYTDAVGKRIGFLDISDASDPRGAGSLSLAQLGDAEDEPTSVAVHGAYVLVVVNTSESFTQPSGRLDVVRLADAKRVRSIDLGGQPDSIDVSGNRGIVAIENERDEEFKPSGGSKGDLPQLPAGFLQVLDLSGPVADWSATKVPLTQADGSALPPFTEAGVVAPTDPEPEYVSINGAGQAAVTLQENNAVALVDLASASVTKVFSAGRSTVSGIDTKKDGQIDQTGSITDVPREPDAIGWVDDQHVATANEGDWKGGTRGWTVFDARTGAVAWDSGNTLEREAVRLGLHNEDRAGKKGIELEGLSLATIDGTRYAFVGSERSNFVAVYDLPSRGTCRRCRRRTGRRASCRSRRAGCSRSPARWTARAPASAPRSPSTAWATLLPRSPRSSRSTDATARRSAGPRSERSAATRRTPSASTRRRTACSRRAGSSASTSPARRPSSPTRPSSPRAAAR